MREGMTFNGAKIALICGSQVVVYLRDDKPEIPFAGLWDLPGGGREGGESPVECALRELEEEFGILIGADRVRWVRRYPSETASALDTYFCVAEISPREVELIRFGNEGQLWRLMEAVEFLGLEAAVPHMKNRLRDYMAGETELT